jgi:mannose/fructose/N-acetylgalactosamine-specific phosphotransferase system component IIB
MATRVDQKLIHGQVTLGWAPFLGVEEIIVADHPAMDSVLLMDIMASGVQPPVKDTFFVTPARLPAYLKSRQGQDPRLMILFRDVAGAYEAIQEGFKPPSLNLGNQFYLTRQETTRLADSFFVNREDLETLIALANQGLKIFFQSLPADEPVPFDPGRYQWIL